MQDELKINIWEYIEMSRRLLDSRLSLSDSIVNIAYMESKISFVKKGEAYSKIYLWKVHFYFFSLNFN